MLDWDNIVPILVVAVLLGAIFKQTREQFVPFNAFQVPIITEKDVADWDVVNRRFGTILQLVNGQRFALSYQLQDMTDVFVRVLNGLGLGEFKVVSIGDTKPFTLFDVNVLDTTMGTPFHFDRIDFIVNSVNPFVVERVVTTPSLASAASAVDPMRPDDLFVLKNPYSLFFPYKTSFNDMAITPAHVAEFTEAHPEVLTGVTMSAPQRSG